MNVTILVENLRQRDEKALASLYDQYGGALNGIIRRILNSEKLAEEVLQQTFLKIWEKIHLYDASKSTLFTWMSRIARNSAIDVTRLKSYQAHIRTDNLDLSIHNKQESKINEASIDTNNLLAKLDKKHNIVLDYIYLRGYSQSQVANELDIPLGTVKTRVRNALLELRVILKSEKKLLIGSTSFLIILISYLCLA